MAKSIIKQSGCILKLTLLSVAVFSLSGCIFSSLGQSTNDTLGQSTNDIHRTVHIHIPFPDTNNQGIWSGKDSKPFTLNSGITHEGGQNVQYIVTGQYFGNWDQSIEFKYNLFLLQSYYFFPEQLQFVDTANWVIDSLFGLTDDWTVYWDSTLAETRTQELMTTHSNGAVGIRLEYTASGDTLTIMQVAPNSPAQRAGLQPGMRIIKVNDSLVAGDTLWKAFHNLTLGDSGTALELTLLQGDSLFTVPLIKDVVEFPSILTDTLEGFGYIRIFSFTSSTYDGKSTADEFKEAIISTKGLPVTLLDLRSNGGGSLQEVIEMCDEILTGGNIIVQQVRNLNENWIPTIETQPITASPSGEGVGGRYILLANRESASSSEIFISALMEGAGVKLVGDTTFGKGVGQSLFDTPAKGMAKITMLSLKTRNGRDYNGRGLYPDYPAQDALAKALEVARQMTGQLAKVSAIQRQRSLYLLELNSREHIKSAVQDILIEKTPGDPGRNP